MVRFEFGQERLTEAAFGEHARGSPGCDQLQAQLQARPRFRDDFRMNTGLVANDEGVPRRIRKGSGVQAERLLRVRCSTGSMPQLCAQKHRAPAGPV
jgi:hypothetical protein